MKKNPLSKKLKLDKRVISKFNAAKVKGGTNPTFRCGTSGNGPTEGTDNCDNTGTVLGGCAPWTIGCPIT